LSVSPIFLIKPALINIKLNIFSLTIDLYSLMSDLVSDTWRTIVALKAHKCMPSSLLHLGDTKMQRVTLRLPEQQIKMIDMLVEYGEFPSASEAIRTAIRDLIDQRSEKLAGRIELLGKVQEQAKHADSFLRMKGEEQ